MTGYAIPLVKGRGAGLGNELFVWGKAFIAAQALGLTPLPPAFGLNARRYSRYFRTPAYDWIIHRALRAALPGATFTEEDYLSNAEHGFAHAVQQFAAARNLPGHGPYVLNLEGMWGGVEAIAPAREYLLGQLLGARWTAENLYEVARRIPRGAIRVGLHIRRGDFAPPDENLDYRSKFNVAIPLDWYVSVARSLSDLLGDRATFLIVSDAPREALAPFGREIPAVFTDDLQNTDISDMLALSSCDLIVCSISSYSLWATFLSEGRYIWFEPNLNRHGEYLSIWGHEAHQQLSQSPTQKALRRAASEPSGLGRGVPVGRSGEIPAVLIEQLLARIALHDPTRDLIHYGVAPHAG